MVRDELLTVELVVDGDCLCMRIDGELDLSTAHLVHRCAAAARRGRDARGGVVLDLRGVTFCDAAGLRALIDIRGWAHARGIAWELWPSRAVLRVVGAAGCGELLCDRR
jgi:anti-anti-sigma factor